MLEGAGRCCNGLGHWLVGQVCRREVSTSPTMAWRSHGTDNASLVDKLQENGIVKSQEVRAAMLAVDRGNYVTSAAYQDAPQRIGFNITISAPHMHAHALELLKDHLTPGSRALDVGSGSGYLTACMAAMVGPAGRVTGIDHVPDLVQVSRENLARDGKAAMVEEGRLQLVAGDGRAGWAEGAPYSAIHVGAAAASLPAALVEQLASPGRMVIPVGPEGGDQSLDLVEKSTEGEVTRRRLMGVIYVPLCSKEHQLGT